MIHDIDTYLSDATTHYIYLGEYENGEYFGKLAEYKFFINNYLMHKDVDKRCIGVYSKRSREDVVELRNICESRCFKNTVVSDVIPIGQSFYEFRVYFRDPSTIRDVLNVLKEIYLYLN